MKIVSRATSGTLSGSPSGGRYDKAARRKAKRSGRETGCWAYIAAEELVAAGFNPHDDPPFYRAHGYQRSANAGSVIVSLYRTKT